MAGIGSFYNTKGVVVGQAMGLIAPDSTPLPADIAAVFDEVTWGSTTIVLGAPSAGTWTVTLSGGSLGPGVSVTVTGIAYNVTSTALATAINAVLPAGVTAVVTGAGSVGSPFLIALVGPAGARTTITASGAGLTGGAFALTPPAFNPLGATEQGWQTAYAPSVQDINIEEQPTPTGRNITTATFELIANLSEDTVENLQYAMASTKTVQAADTTHYGVTQLNLSGDLVSYAVVLETKNRFKLPRRIYIPSATCAVNVGQTFARARGQRLIPVTFSSVCPTESIVIREITANHT